MLYLPRRSRKAKKRKKQGVQGAVGTVWVKKKRVVWRD